MAAATLCPKGGPILLTAGALPDHVEAASDPLANAIGVTIAGGYAYWATETVIHRISLATKVDTVLLDHSSADNRISGFAVDGAALYFDESGFYQPTGLAKMAADGSDMPVALGASDEVSSVTAKDGYVYYYDGRAGGIARLPAAGGTPTVLVHADAVGLMVAGGYVYFVHPHANADNYHVFRVPIDAQAVATDMPPANGAVPLPGAEVVASVGPFGAWPAADDTSVFWGDAGTLMKAPLAGGTPSMVATAPTTTTSAACLPAAVRCIGPNPASSPTAATSPKPAPMAPRPRSFTTPKPPSSASTRATCTC
jgi:hypothetical protein